jgi:hypothetical protein
MNSIVAALCEENENLVEEIMSRVHSLQGDTATKLSLQVSRPKEIIQSTNPTNSPTTDTSGIMPSHYGLVAY